MMNHSKDLEYCRQSFEKADYPHYLVSLMMPKDKRAALWTLGALKNVIETIPASVTNPALGYMRLTWWRDQVTLLEQGSVTKGQPILSALQQYGGRCEISDLVNFINDHETAIENPDAEFFSPSYPRILEKILGADIAKYRKLENAATAIMKKHHGTKWENHPPFLALRLWFTR